MLLEVGQLKQPGAVPLRGEDEFVLFPIMAQFKGRAVKGGCEQPGAGLHQLFADRRPVLLVQQGPQFLLARQKSGPGLLRPHPEGLDADGEGQLSAPFFRSLLRFVFQTVVHYTPFLSCHFSIAELKCIASLCVEILELQGYAGKIKVLFDTFSFKKKYQRISKSSSTQIRSAASLPPFREGFFSKALAMEL